jgi:predicted ABC-type ATPase
LCRLTRAGAGKTTLVKSVRKDYPQFTRISIDDIIYKAHGIYGVDYPASPTLYGQHMDEADRVYLDTFRRLLAERKDIAFERSCYAKEDRDEWRKIAEDAGARVVLVFLRADDKEVLWRRRPRTLRWTSAEQRLRCIGTALRTQKVRVRS